MKQQQHLVGMLNDQQSTAVAGISEGDDLTSLVSSMGAQPNDISAPYDYQLPSDAALNKYARAVYEKLAIQRQTPSAELQDMVIGLGTLLKLLFRLEAQRLNKTK